MAGVADPSPERPPFVLAPFRGLRYDAERVGDLGTVISPPYDVLDAEIVRDLEAANRRNIVRLILSRSFEQPYLAVRKRLDSWRRKGFLRADDDAALYLYQYTVDQVSVRGLVGVVALRAEAEQVVLPHEDVMPGPVGDRMLLMRATETNLEPILLVHEGTNRLRRRLEEVAEQDPVVDFAALDGSHHTLWRIVDEQGLDLVAAELNATQALIADGHHRYAAYLELQAQMRRTGCPAGRSPWDYGLALLVDQGDYPLEVGPIHRSVSAVTLSDVDELSAERGDELVALADREAAVSALSREEAAEGTATFGVSDGENWAILRTPRARTIDAAVLHDVLFPAWGVGEDQLGYHHSIDQALQATARQPGIVLVLQPPSLQQVMATAARGIRMPRKSTSFSPKPRMGVLMRDLRDA